MYPYVKVVTAKQKKAAVNLLKIMYSIDEGTATPQGALSSTEIYAAAALLSIKPGAAADYWDRVEEASMKSGNGEDATTIIKTRDRLRHVIDNISGWSAPDEIDESADNSPEFPSDVFPDMIERYVTSVSDTLQVPRAAVSTALLASTALAAQGKFCVSYIDDTEHTEHLCVYAVVSQHPGERKSATISEVSKPVRAWIAETMPTYKQECAKVSADAKALAAQARGLEKGISKANDTEPEKLEEMQTDLEKILQKKALLQNPPSPHMLLDDTTPEALCRTLESTGETAGIFTAEGDVLRIFGGLYSSGTAANLSLPLKAYSGEQYRHTRASGVGTDIYLESPLLTMCVFAQPELALEFFGNAQLQGRGLPARFLLCTLPRRAGTLKVVNDGHTINKTAAAEYQTTIQDLLSIPRPKDSDPPAIGWTDSAKAVIIPHLQHIQDMMKEGGELYGGLEDYGSKAAAHCIRIAGLLHILKNPCTPNQYEQLDVTEATTPTIAKQIDAETAEHAVKINSYYLQQRIQQSAAADNEPLAEAAELFKSILERTVYSGKAYTSKSLLLNNLRRRKNLDDSLNTLQGLHLIEIATEPGTKREAIYLSPHAAHAELEANADTILDR